MRTITVTRSREAIGRLLLVLLALLLALTLITALIAATVGHVSLSGRVYTVPEVRAGLVSNPRAWAGHTVLIRGRLVEALWTRYNGAQPPPDPLNPPSEASVHLLLARDDVRDVQSAAVIGSGLWLSPHLPAANPLVVVLRKVPVLGGLVPASPGLLTRAVYRVQLFSLHSTRCTVGHCDDGLLLNVAQ